MPANQASRRQDGKTELTVPELAWQALRQAVDPFGMLSAPWHAQLAWWTHPQDLLRQVDLTWRETQALYEHGLQRLLGVQPDDPVVPKVEDERFADPVWLESAGFDILKEGFLSLDHRLRTLNHRRPASARTSSSRPISGSTTGSMRSRRATSSGPTRARSSTRSRPTARACRRAGSITCAT